MGEAQDFLPTDLVPAKSLEAVRVVEGVEGG
jgi:hypothetical protein